MVWNCLWRFFTIHACAKVILKIFLDVNFWSRCGSTVKFYSATVQNKFVNWKFSNFRAQNLLWSDSGLNSPEFAAKCTFLLAAHRAVSANWDFEFYLWWGFGKSLRYIRKSSGLRTEPYETPVMGLILSERKPFMLTWTTRPTGKSESRRVILVGRSSMKILYLSPLCQTLSKAFPASRKAATACSPLFKIFITDWKSLKRWSSVDLFCLKVDWYLFMKPMSSRQERSLCSITRWNSFIIELIRLVGL